VRENDEKLSALCQQPQRNGPAQVHGQPDRLDIGLPWLTPSCYNGDLKYTVDFRSVYAAVLKEWLKTPSGPILGRKFEPLKIV